MPRHIRARFAVSALLVLSALLPSATRASETERLASALDLRPGMRVADVGAGQGEWAEELAARVGPRGHVYATEVEQEKVDAIAQRLQDARIDNATTLLGDQSSTGLPLGCCDAILLRLVYHHFTDPATMRADLARAMRPGARLVIVDTGPHHSWRNLPGVPDRGGHGIAVEDLVDELEADGFELIERHDDWPDDDAEYCLVFRARAQPRHSQ